MKRMWDIGIRWLVACVLSQEVAFADSTEPLIVVGVATQEERATAERLIKLAPNPASLQTQAKAEGYKIIQGENVYYLIPPRYWRDETMFARNELCELLLVHSPMQPFSVSQLTPPVLNMLFRLMTTTVPVPKETVERLLTSGYLWWGGSLTVEVQLDGDTYKSISFHLDRDESVNLPLSSLSISDEQEAITSRNQQFPTSQSVQRDIKVKEESLLFSREIPQHLRIAHAKAYLEWVLYGYEEMRKRLEMLEENLRDNLIRIHGLPVEWQEEEYVDFSTLPQWMRAEIASRLAGNFKRKAEGISRQSVIIVEQDDIQRALNLLVGAKVKGIVSPRLVIGGLVKDRVVEKYAFSLDMLD